MNKYERSIDEKRMFYTLTMYLARSPETLKEMVEKSPERLLERDSTGETHFEAIARFGTEEAQMTLLKSRKLLAACVYPGMTGALALSENGTPKVREEIRKVFTELDMGLKEIYDVMVNLRRERHVPYTAENTTLRR